MKILLRDFSVYITCSVMILGIIGLPSIIRSSSLSLSLSYTSNPYQLVFAQQAPSPSGQQQQQNRPNILLIVSDDFGWSDIGAFGSQISTPNLDSVDHHIGGIGSMYELIAANQKGKLGYETWINNRVVTVAELLRAAGYHTYMSGKWHLSGSRFENGTWPHDRGFEKDLTLLNGGGNHFGGFPELPLEKVQFAENGKMIPSIRMG
jgi:arylsulfatase A-like enzyme